MARYSKRTITFMPINRIVRVRNEKVFTQVRTIQFRLNVSFQEAFGLWCDFAEKGYKIRDDELEKYINSFRAVY